MSHPGKKSGVQNVKTIHNAIHHEMGFSPRKTAYYRPEVSKKEKYGPRNPWSQK